MKDLIGIVHRIKLRGFKSAAPGILITKALAVIPTMDEEEFKDKDSALGEAFELVRDQQEQYPELTTWAKEAYGECAKCGKVLSYEENDYLAGWCTGRRYETAYHYECWDIVTREVVERIVNEKIRSIGGMPESREPEIAEFKRKFLESWLDDSGALDREAVVLRLFEEMWKRHSFPEETGDKDE